MLLGELGPQWAATAGLEPWTQATGAAASLINQLSHALRDGASEERETEGREKRREKRTRWGLRWFSRRDTLRDGPFEAYGCDHRPLAMLVRRGLLPEASRVGWKRLASLGSIAQTDARSARLHSRVHCSAASTDLQSSEGAARAPNGTADLVAAAGSSGERRWWPESASRAGFCAVTSEGDEGDCSRHGSSGSWNTRLHRIQSLGECAARCMLCEQCRFVTYSSAENDCSWYSSCDLKRLGQMGGFRSLRVRRADHAAAAPELERMVSTFVEQTARDRAWQSSLVRGSLRLLFDALTDATADETTDAATDATATASAADDAATGAQEARAPPLVSFRCVEPDFVFNNRELLPESPCGDPTSDSAERREQLRLVRMLRVTAAAHKLSAEISSCAPSSAFHREIHLSGFASMLNSLLKPMTAAFRLGRAFMTPMAPGITEPCASHDLSCFFEPLGPRCERTSRAVPELRFNLAQLRQESHSAHAGAAIPEPFRAQGAFWWPSQLLSLLMRPAPPLAARLGAALDESGLGAVLANGEPVIGLHVRHGDACIPSERRRTRRVCEPLARYMDALRPYARRHGVRTIFLATDSEEALAETAHFPHFRFVRIGNVSRTGVEHKAPNEILDEVLKKRQAEGRGLRHSYEAAMLAAVDTILLSRCQMLVGKFTSGLFRTAYALASARTNALPPFISLDAPWCSDYEIAAGRNFDFPFRDGAYSPLVEQLGDLAIASGGTTAASTDGHTAAPLRNPKRPTPLPLRNVMANAFHC